VHPFRAAVEGRDMAAAVALLAEDVVFRSPVVFTPYRGRDAVGTILHAVSEVFEDFRYVREVGAAGEPDHVLVFHARVGGLEIEGIDLLHTAADGQVDELTVMVRPLKAALALAEAMQAKLAAAQGTPGAG
jgi:hypothetical protein